MLILPICSQAPGLSKLSHCNYPSSSYLADLLHLRYVLFTRSTPRSKHHLCLKLCRMSSMLSSSSSSKGRSFGSMASQTRNRIHHQLFLHSLVPLNRDELLQLLAWPVFLASHFPPHTFYPLSHPLNCSTTDNARCVAQVFNSNPSCEWVCDYAKCVPLFSGRRVRRRQ